MTRSEGGKVAMCCGRPMSVIEVTSPLNAPGSTLGLHTCSACGMHIWERDGIALDRDGVLGVVKARIADGPVRRVPAPRASRAKPVRERRAAMPAVAAVPPVDLRDRLAGFTVHGT